MPEPRIHDLIAAALREVPGATMDVVYLAGTIPCLRVSRQPGLPITGAHAFAWESGGIPGVFRVGWPGHPDGPMGRYGLHFPVAVRAIVAYLRGDDVPPALTPWRCPACTFLCDGGDVRCPVRDCPGERPAEEPPHA